ncbi:hypothetical protein TDB9533_02490 [Thalassocella blandensis]|nr:hypothetical protein TDB9533_02490 [Thalassocella blandensis]
MMKIYHYPKTLLTILLGVFLVLAYFVKDFKVDASADTLLTKNNKDYIRTQIAGIRYNPEEFILIALKPHEGDIFSKSNLSVLSDIARDLEAIEEVTQVNSIVNMPIFAIDSGILDVVDPTNLTWEEKQYSREDMHRVLAGHPLYEDTLYNREQTALGLQVIFKEHKALTSLNKKIVNIKQNLLDRELKEEEKRTLEQLEKRQDILSEELDKQRYQDIDAIREALKPYEKNAEVFLGGNTLLAKQLIDIIKADLVLFGLTIIGIVEILLWYLFVSWRWVLLPLLTCAYSIVCTLGLLGMLGLKVTVISANVIALQIILTLAIVIHLIIQYRELVKQGDDTHVSLTREMVKLKLKPCLYAGITTSVGFASLIFSGIQPIISFGWMMVLALSVTLVAGLMFFPALVLTLCRSVDRSERSHPLIGRFLNFSQAAVLKRGGLILGLSAGLFILGVTGCFFLTAENSFLNYFKGSTDVKKELSFIDQNFGGSTPLDIIYTLPEREKAIDLEIAAEDMQMVEALQYALDQNEAIGDTMSIADFARVAKAVRGKPLTEFEVSVVYKILGDDIKEKLFGPYYDAENNELRISMRIKDTTEGLNREELKKQIEQEIVNAGIPRDKFTLTNLFVLYQDVLQRLVNSQFVTFAIVYVLMFGIMLLVFRSIKIALISMVPNMVTVALVMGGMGWMHIPLDIMTMTIAAVAMGISVDDTIHYIHRFQQESKAKTPVAEEKSTTDSVGMEDGAGDPVALTHRSIGYALVYTTLIIVIGFGSLCFSKFVPSLIFGVLTGATMIVALLADLFLLPVLLHKFSGKRQPLQNAV